ncbi:D-alanyl-D-alanine carboxypeptidase [Streptomyces sp. NBC_00663]
MEAGGDAEAAEGPEGASKALDAPEADAEAAGAGERTDGAPKADAAAETGREAESGSRADATTTSAERGTDEPADAPRDKPATISTGAAPKADEPRDAQDTPEPADKPAAATPKPDPRAAASTDAPEAAEGDKAPQGSSAPGDAGRATDPTDAPQAAEGEKAPQGAPAPGDASRATDRTDASPPAGTPQAAEGDKAPQGSSAPGDVGRATGPTDPTDAPQAAEGEKAPQGAAAPGDASRATDPTDAPQPTGVSQPTDTPQAADGDKAPQGPPAPGDESRTGGAGGKQGEADGVAEAGRQVDQPTTMLKLPRATPAAERTSKFVALKPDVTTPVPVPVPVPHVGPERTTQQPLPPKPPLDLLAELTNTPRPPETPLRTTVRRVKIWTPLVLLLAVIFAVVQSVRPLPTPTLQLTAEDSYSFDGSKVDIPWPADGQGALDVQGIGSFGSSGDQKPVPIASVAKVMTAYLVLRDHPLKSGAKGPNIKIDQTAQDEGAAKSDESKVSVTAGDALSQREALESILIASANNIARLLARWDAGSEKAFVEKMNDAAEDLGMTNTTYTDPSGLNNTTVSTAVDQVKLAKKAMEYPAFREVAAMMSYDDYKGQNHPNWNQLVGKNDVVGIKTGTTTSALGNLVFAAKKEVNGETRTIVGAVLRQPAGGLDNTILSAALTAGDQLIRAAQGALESATIIKKGEVVGYVDDGLGGHTPVVATKDVTAVGWSGLTVKLTFAADDVPHTAKAGTKVGTLTVGDASAGAVAVPVALQTDLAEPGFTDKLTRLG